MAQWNGGISKITLPTPFSVGDVNVYVVKGEVLTLIDAGVKTKEAWNIFIGELDSLGLTPADIEQVVLTHHHPDHTGLLDYLPNIPVLGHPYGARWMIRDRKFVEEYETFYRQMYSEFSVPDRLAGKMQRMEGTWKFASRRPLTGELREGMEVPGLSGWTVLETPGHAQSHICLFHKGTNTMIGGDHLLAAISSNPILEPPLFPGLERPKPQLQYNESLKKVADFPIHKIYTGHGHEVTAVSQLVSHRLHRQHERAMKIKEMITMRPLTGFDICRQVFPKACERELNLAVSEIIGQLDYLRSLGEIVETVDDEGKIRYMAA